MAQRSESNVPVRSSSSRLAPTTASGSSKSALARHARQRPVSSSIGRASVRASQALARPREQQRAQTHRAEQRGRIGDGRRVAAPSEPIA